MLHVNNSVEGEPLCRKIERMISNKEPIESVSPIIYTPKKDGVIAAYNIRTDRWKIAQNAMNAANKSWIAKRQEAMNKTEPKSDKTSESGTEKEVA